MIGRVAEILRRDATTAAASAGVRSVGRLAAGVLIARLAGAGEFATFTLLVSIETIIVCTLAASLASPASVLMQRRSRRVRAMVAAFAERTQAACGLASGAVCAVVAMLSGVPEALALAFGAAVAASAAFQGVRATRVSFFQTRRLCAAECAIATLSLVPIVMLTRTDPLLGFWIGQALTQSAASVWLRSGWRVGGASRAGVVRRAVLSRGMHMLAGSVAVSLMGRTQPLILAATMGAPAVAVFGAASMFAAPVRMASGAARGVLLPRLAARRGRTIRWTARSVAWVSGGLLAGVLGSWGAAMILVPTVFGNGFDGAVVLVPTVMACAFAAAGSSVVVTMLQARDRSGVCAGVRWGAAVLAPVLLVPAGVFGSLLVFAAVGVVLECAVIVVLLRVDRRRARSSVVCTDPVCALAA